MKLSNQAIGAIMFALQNSLAHQTDIQPEFESWDLFMKDGELFVENPPHLDIGDEDFDEYGDEIGTDEIVDFLTTPIDLED